MRLITMHSLPIVLRAYDILDSAYQPPVEALTGMQILEMPKQWMFSISRITRKAMYKNEFISYG